MYITPSSSIQRCIRSNCNINPDIHQTRHRRKERGIREEGGRRKGRFDNIWRKIHRRKTIGVGYEKREEEMGRKKGKGREWRKEREGKGHGRW
jgi:hypothetical protein